MCLVTFHPIESFNSVLICLIPLATCTLCGYEFRSGHECWFQVSLISYISGVLSMGWFSLRSVHQHIVLLELDLNGAGTFQWGWSLQQQNKKTEKDEEEAWWWCLWPHNRRHLISDIISFFLWIQLVSQFSAVISLGINIDAWYCMVPVLK